MKFRTRIATAVTLAIASILVANPAFASGGHEESGSSIFDRSQDPFSYVAIAVLAVILLAVVLGTSTWIGGMFEKNAKNRQR